MSTDMQYTQAELDAIGNQLSELNPDKLPPHYKRSGDDWHAVFNPNVTRRLDVDLVHNLVHQSVVCCVRFSQDGRFVATGCNRSAQIFDVNTGEQVCHLQDASSQPDGDLYIRSVCFSPNGRYLATGAEDKIIRVSMAMSHMPIEMLTILIHRYGTSKPAKSATRSQATSKISTVLTSLPMAVISLPAAAIAPFACGIFKTISAC